MAQSHSTPSDYAVNTTNGITFFEGLTQAMPHILARPSYTPCYHFMLEVMNRTEASMLADVFYLSTLSTSVVEMFDGERHILCTTAYLAMSGMKWTREEQIYSLDGLEKKGFIRRVKRGMPARRWIVIEWKNIADAIQSAGQPDGKSSGNSCNQSSGKPIHKQSGKPDGKSSGIPDVKESNSKKSKELDVPHPPAASPPPGDATDSHPTKPKKAKQHGPGPTKYETTRIVYEDTQSPLEVATTPVVYDDTVTITCSEFDESHPFYEEFKDIVKPYVPPQRVKPPERVKPTTSKAPPKKSGGLLGDEAEKDSQELRWAKRLWELVHRKYPTIKTLRPSQWVIHFTELLKDTTAANIERVLTWYEANIGKDRFYPQAHSGESFRDKFHLLEIAMKPKPLTEQQQRDKNVY